MQTYPTSFVLPQETADTLSDVINKRFPEVEISLAKREEIKDSFVAGHVGRGDVLVILQVPCEGIFVPDLMGEMLVVLGQSAPYISRERQKY